MTNLGLFPRLFLHASSISQTFIRVLSERVRECSDEDNGPELTSGVRRVTGPQFPAPGHTEQTTPRHHEHERTG